MAPTPTPTPTVTPAVSEHRKGLSPLLSLTEAEFVRPDRASLCQWSADADPTTSPHTRCPLQPASRVLPNILHHVGHTPLVRLNRIPQSFGVKCEMLAKCEFFNAGGSVKDRIALRMMEDAEKKGLIKPGSTLIEPTSGNTGIGVALAAAVKGYRAILVMPEKMSNEKVAVMRALGAEIVRTPDDAAWDSADSHISVAQRLQKQIPGSVILDQYRNAGNPLAHYDTTAEELLAQCQGRIDMVVCGAGTGGTATGVGRKLKERCPGCVVVAADPHGSVLGHDSNEDASHCFFEVEGVGYDFYPTVLDRDVVDVWVKTGDKDSFVTARRLIREEGLLCGGSCGTAVWAACQAAKDLPEEARVVVILADSVRNYMTKFLDDEWMAQRGFIDPVRTVQRADSWWEQQPVSVLHVNMPQTVTPGVTCQDAIDIMNREGTDHLPVVDQSGHVHGMVTLGSLMPKLVARKVEASTPVEEVLNSSCKKISTEDTLEKLSLILEKDHFALIVHKHNSSLDNSQTKEREKITGVVTQINLLTYVMGAHSNTNGQKKGTTSLNGGS